MVIASSILHNYVTRYQHNYGGTNVLKQYINENVLLSFSLTRTYINAGYNLSIE